MNRMGGDVSDLNQQQRSRRGSGRRGGRSEEQEKYINLSYPEENNYALSRRKQRRCFRGC